MNKVIIIGGGIAGLSAGIFAQKNGFQSVILEKNKTLGGECTGWDRQGYHIDGCIHWLVGTKKGTPINDLWVNVGALDGVEIYHPESFLVFDHGDVMVHFYRDLDRLQSSWLDLSPQDEEAINEFCKTIKRMQSYEISVDKPMDMMGIAEKIRYMLSVKDVGTVLMKYQKVSLKEYAKTFKHPALRKALASFLPDGYSALSVFFALAAFTKGQASLPYGGSKKFSQRMVERYSALGGVIEAPCEAIGLELERNKVRGVVCGNGKIIKGDYFIVACDARVLYDRLLKGRYNDPQFQKRYDDPKDYPLASEIRIAIGLEDKIDNIPRSLRFPITPFKVNETWIDLLTMTHYGHDPSFAPSEHTLITCSINQFYSDYDAWNTLYRDTKAYQLEKARIGQEVIRSIETRFPQMKGKLKLLDVATPKTFERYCNAYRGAFMSFLPTVNGKMMAHTGRIEGLQNIFLSGQWLQPPGGLPVALVTGKDTIMRLCKMKKQPFNY